jgi:hypothetical protein
MLFAEVALGNRCFEQSAFGKTRENRVRRFGDYPSSGKLTSGRVAQWLESL